MSECLAWNMSSAVLESSSAVKENPNAKQTLKHPFFHRFLMTITHITLCFFSNFQAVVMLGTHFPPGSYPTSHGVEQESSTQTMKPILMQLKKQMQLQINQVIVCIWSFGVETIQLTQVELKTEIPRQGDFKQKIIQFSNNL